MPTVLSEPNQECLRCRVPDDCDSSHELCGIRIGIKYGHYKASAKNALSIGIPNSMSTRDTCGAKEKPLFRQNDGMFEFCKSVAKYSEPGLILINDFTGVSHE